MSIRTLRSGLRLLWDVLPLVLLLLVALAAFILDPEAVVRLAWACMTGTFGTTVQLAVSALVIVGGAATIWAFRQPEPTEGPQRRNAAQRSRKTGARSDGPPIEGGRKPRRPASARKTVSARIDIQDAAAKDADTSAEAKASAESVAGDAEARKPRQRSRVARGSARPAIANKYAAAEPLRQR